MSPQKLQTDKLLPADLPEICAPRLELLSRFDRVSDKRCIYVNAPAGSGKTISTRLWLQKAGREPIWLGLDEYDNNLAAFYRLFCAAFFAVIPQEESLHRIIRDAAFSASPVEYTIEVLSRFSFDEHSYALVMDDFHLITEEEIRKSLLYVIKRLPLSVIVVFLSRSELPRAFLPLEESGRIGFIGPAELAFRSNEIRSYFAGFGRFITEEEAKAALALTEGWAIAVSALALSGEITAGDMHESNPLWKFIKNSVWDKLDAELQRFMLRTSVADKFSAELCEHLTRNPQCRKLLDRLLGGNMFLSRQDGDYRYHHLFLAFLREEAVREIPAERQDLYKKAADYYSETGDHFNALRYYIKCSDSPGIAGALYRYLKFCGQSSSDLSRIYFINELPSDMLEENPVLYISCAYCAALFSSAENLYFYLDRVYERLKDIIRDNGDFFTSVLFLLTVDPRYTFTEQMAKLRSVSAPRSLAGQYMPKTLNHNMPYPHRGFRDHSYFAGDTEAYLAEFRNMYFPILGSYHPIIETGIKAGLLYEKNALMDALKLVAADPDTDSGELIFTTKMLRTACLYMLGRKDEAANIRLEIKTLLKTEGLLYLLPVFSAYETKLRLLDGDRMRAREWLDNYFVTEVQKPELNRNYLHLTTIRAYIVLGEFAEARRLCLTISKFSADFYRLLDKTEAEVLLTIVLWLTGAKKEALQLLRELLAVAEPHGFIRVFADEGKALLPVLKKLLKQSVQAADAPGSGHRYLQEVYQAAYEQAGRLKGIAVSAKVKPIKLSGRQKYVLELLAKGYRNAEIVEMSGLSINTIRSHTKTAYQKLEVNNVLDAVTRAKELGLIAP